MFDGAFLRCDVEMHFKLVSTCFIVYLLVILSAGAEFLKGIPNIFSSSLLNQSSDILQHSQNRPTGDRWLKF